MAIKHGIYVYEQPTSIIAPVQVDSAVQVVIGTAPINLGDVENPLSTKIAYSYDEAVKKIGYSGNIMNFTLCQSIKASFEIYNVSPVVFINVLDPKKHTKTLTDTSAALIEGKAVIAQEGILLASVTVKASDGADQLDAGTDYTAYFNSSGHLAIEAVDGGAITSAVTTLSVSYKQLDVSLVVEADILAGIRKITEVYPKFGIVPGLLLCPGWTHKPEIYMALTAKTENLNGMFKSLALTDLDTTEANTYDKCNAIKSENGMININSVVLWPMARVGDSVFYMSALLGAHMAYVDYQNEGVPYVSPSNKAFKVSGICTKDGAEVVLDVEVANLLNGQGINTAINLNGWRFWGNYTAAYPATTDVKDVFIPVRRMFSWWGNTFILTYFQKVDDPMNKRLIESVVDSENIRANGFKARFQIADAHIEYRTDDNPQTDLLNGIIRFHQYLTPYPPAQAIINTLEFNPDALSAALA